MGSSSRTFRLFNSKSRTANVKKMAGNQKLVVFNLAIIFPIFVLTIIFPIFVLAGPRPRDGSSPDLDLKDTGRPWNSSDASTLAELFVNSTSRLFNANEGDDPLGSPEVEGNLDLPPAFFIDADGPFDPATGLLIKPDQEPATSSPRQLFVEEMLAAWPNCKCIRPAKFSSDGCGNCNVDSAHDDQRPWCYTSHFLPEGEFGVAVLMCPDQKESVEYPGFYRSRFACLRGAVNSLV